MKVDPTGVQKAVQEKVVSQSQNRNEHFSKLIRKQVSGPRLNVDSTAQPVEKTDISTLQNPDLLHLGKITETVPTVSNLLVKHPAYRKSIWRILKSEQNKDKPYREIKPGTDIYLDTKTLAISWDPDGVRSTTRPENELTVLQKNSGPMGKTGEAAGKAAEPIGAGPS